MEKPNYLEKISNAEILEKLSRLRGTEIWNATYSDAVNDLCGKGFIITVEPFETKATKYGIAWYLKYSKICTDRSVYHHDYLESYLNWKDAMDTVILDALDNYLYNPDKNETRMERDTDNNQEYASEFYARHSEEDPYPFE